MTPILKDIMPTETIFTIVGEFRSWAFSYKDKYLTDHTTGKSKRIDRYMDAERSARMKLYNYFENEKLQTIRTQRARMGK